MDNPRTLESITGEILRLFPRTPLIRADELGVEDGCHDFRWLVNRYTKQAFAYDELSAEDLMVNRDEILVGASESIFRHCLPAYLLIVACCIFNRDDLLKYGDILDSFLYLLSQASKNKKKSGNLGRFDYLSTEQLILLRDLIHTYIEMPMEATDSIDDKTVYGALRFLNGRIESKTT